MADPSNEIRDEVGIVSRLRDELGLQIHLARAELRDQFHAAEGKWSHIQGELKRLPSLTGEPAHKALENVREMIRDVGVVYRRVRDVLAEESRQPRP